MAVMILTVSVIIEYYNKVTKTVNKMTSPAVPAAAAASGADERGLG